MCLYIGNKVALIAKKDITVYKRVKQTPDSNEYVTPYQKTKVNLNEILKPDSEMTYHHRYRKYYIAEGAIHAYICTPNTNNVNVYDINYLLFHDVYAYLKAIIKKGTTYYVQDDFKEVAAAELYITDEIVEGEVTSPDLKDICNDYINAISNNKNFTNKDGIHIGDYILSDKTYVNTLSKFDHTKAIGIVAYFDKNDKPVITALEYKHLPWITNGAINDYKACSEINDVEKDIEGKKHTYDIANSNNYNPQVFKPIAYCTEYKTNGTEKGDWYLGATGELIAIAINMAIINASIMYTGVGKPLEISNCAWTSSEKTTDGSCTWTLCDLSDGLCINFSNHTDIVYLQRKYYVRPFYCPQTHPEEHSTKHQ